jgi:hypothetical protein
MTTAVVLHPENEHCRACRGGPCKGGGNKRCWRRDPRPARIAIILDSYGGARTIVGTKWNIKANTRHDELCHKVPKLIVHEPIAWNDIPYVIERARIELLAWLCTLPNLNEVEHECVTMYRLRCSENGGRGPSGSLNLYEIVET